MSKLTPFMEQYSNIKKYHKDKILFFRMGDFFEMFNEDAQTAAPIINIALTCRNKKSEIKTKMCGVPHHSISGPISKLLRAGLTVAICDQIETAEEAKGLVKRAVTRILSPGMVYDLESLDKLKANYILAFDKNHMSFLDVSTGSAFYYKIKDKSDFFKLLDKYQPSEILVSSSQKEKSSQFILAFSTTFSLFDHSFSKEDLPSPLNLEEYKNYPESAKRLLYYIYSRQGKESLKILNSFEIRNLDKEMYYSRQLYSHLEVFKNYDGSGKDTLFFVINRTKTPSGARLLKRRLQSPLKEQHKIEKRFDEIDFWISKPDLLKSVRNILSQMGDPERKLGKLIQPNCNGRDLLDLKWVLDRGFEIHKLIDDKFLSLELEQAKILRDKIHHRISINCPATLKEGGIINQAVHPQLDEWIHLSKNSQAKLLEMEKREQKNTGIGSLKIRYNQIFGYYIEVRKNSIEKVPAHYRRKQTLVNVERYTIEELNVLEEKLLSARSKQIEMECSLFQDLRLEVLDGLSNLTKLCYHWSEIDVCSSLAFLAIENKYVRPQFTSHFKLVASRHPVIERKSFHEFIPNTIEMSSSETLILTGPNMAGKSTLMRQVALSVLLAQSGCFVPADQAEFPIFNKIFTRIGASDFLSQGLSTFMVEMKETAEILEEADDKSLIILDEIGRGTATFDGMSLARSILEFLTIEKKPLLFSATHYQELTDLANQYTSIRNASMAIREEEDQINFLYLLQEGPAGRSYGIQVARLAGLPDQVVKKANRFLKQYESSSKNRKQVDSETFCIKETNHNKEQSETETINQTKEIENKEKLQNKTKKVQLEFLIKEILQYPLVKMSPLDAMNQIHKWQRFLKALHEVKSKKTLKTKPYSISDQKNFSDILN